MARHPKYSLVELFEQSKEDSSSGGHCGYCGGNGNISDGIWGYRLTVTDYEHLLQRGWRRSGKYVYKPNMKRTCCPQYAIRCEALKFRLTRSQKKVLKKMYKFLAYGVGEEKIKRPTAENGVIAPAKTLSPVDYHSDGEADSDDVDFSEELCGESFLDVAEPKNKPEISSDDLDEVAVQGDSCPASSAQSRGDMVTSVSPVECGVKKNPPGVGSDLSRPPQRKAKDIRRDRRLQKMATKGMDPSSKSTKLAPEGATLESFFEKKLPENPKHLLEFRLVSTSEMNDEFALTFADSLELYKKYEITVHHKLSDKPDGKQFSRFLAESPLQQQFGPGQTNRDSPVYGSFHLQYVLDGKIIGVDVLDVLPDCITSVYFFYDTDYRYLSLGTYSVLREMYMVRQLNRRFPEITYVSLGFYVNSCPKMHYKAKFHPSFLLCPETYNWHPLEKCLEKLSVKNYQRFASFDQLDEDGNVSEYLNTTLILFQKVLMTFEVYKMTLQKIRRPAPPVLRKEIERVTHYAALVGRKCATTLALYCDNAAINACH